MSGGMSVLPMLLHSLWTAFQSITGMAGVTPVQFGYGLLGLIGLLVLFTIGQTIRSRNSFSLDASKSEWNV